jgi:3-oxoacyl-[acyl-carrier protein] reductase
MKRLEGKRALITGGAAGIGRSTALLFAQEGARVAVLDRHAAGAQETCSQIRGQGGSGIALTGDVTELESLVRAFHEVEREFGGLDILVNNAGTAKQGALADIKHEEWQAVIATNLSGAMLCTQTALPLLKKAGTAKVINMASILASRASRRLAAYSASKAGLLSLTRSLALELGPYGIRVNAISPGFIRTEMTRGYHTRWLVRKFIEHRIPLHRFGEPEDVARVALFLASSDSDFITGADITVDGGVTLRAL